MLKFSFFDLETVQSTIKLNETRDYPIFYSIFGQKDSVSNSLIPDQTIINSFTQFLNQSKEKNSLNTIIQKVVSTQEEVIIWGAGQFASKLLASSVLSRANIIAFVDSDKSKQHKKLGQFEVYSPDFIADKNVTLIICSALYTDEIIKVALHLNKNIKYIVLN